MTDQEALAEAKRRWSERYGEDRVFCMRPLGLLFAAGVSGTDAEEGFVYQGDS